MITSRSTLFTSALFKLTVSYLAVMAVICFMFSAAIYHFADNELQYGLHRQSQRIAEQFPGFDFDPALRTQRDYTDGSHRILLNLAYFNVIVLVFAGFVSYGLAKRTLQPIEASHNQQKRFTADVSHELRTPLTALKMTSEVALLDTAASKANLRAALESNLEDAGRLEQLINNLLRLTRLEFSELQGHFETIVLSDVVDEALKSVHEQAAAKHVKVKTTVPVALHVQGDHSSLTQLVTIFLDNAVKYSTEKSTVTITGRADAQSVLLDITDDGTGIAAEALPHIFDRFYRSDSARTGQESGGFGLGLSIAKTIAELHNGRIQLTSAPGLGTSVLVTLPAAKA